MAEQLPLGLPVNTSMMRDDFLVSDANAQAIALIDSWPHWPAPVQVIAGPAGAGKSHLAAIAARSANISSITAAGLAADFVDRSDGWPLVIVEDCNAGRLDEEALFHLINAVRLSGRHLLLTATAAPSRWGLGLPDLISRLNAANITRLGPPDEALLAAVLMKQFADRQVAVEAGVIDYLVSRMSRDFASLREIVQALDATALQQRRAITVPLARSVLASVGE